MIKYFNAKLQLNRDALTLTAKGRNLQSALFMASQCLGGS